MNPSLNKETCVPYHGGIEALTTSQVNDLLRQLEGWRLHAGHLTKRYLFPDFASALAFVNDVSSIAERQNHHPRICFTWGQVDLELWTHAIAGLHRNDFILAAHIDELEIPDHQKN